jgi:hypothetical protein
MRGKEEGKPVEDAGVEDSRQERSEARSSGEEEEWVRW